MKIVHVIKHFPTFNLEYQELALAREQVKLGHDVTIITGDWHNPFPEYEEVYEPIIGERYVGTGIFYKEGIFIIRLKIKDKPQLLTRLINLKKILKIISPDLIICHGLEVGLLPIQSKLKNIPLIIDSHYLPVQRHIYKNNFRLINYIFNKAGNKILSIIKTILLRGDLVKFVGVTEESVLNIANLIKVPISKIEFIPLGADLKNYFISKDLREKKRNKLGFTDKDIVLIYTGKIEKYKGVHLILEAMHLINKSNLHIILIGGGSSKHNEYILNLRDKYKLNKKVKFYSFCNKQELNAFFNAADIAVYPKSITISHLEAMAAGLPLIIENLPGSQHRLKYNNGYFVEKDNVKDLKEKIELLVDNKKNRIEMCKRGRELVEKEMNWGKINERFLALHSN